MSLKAFLVGICLIIVTVMTGVFYSKTSSLLGRHFEEIEKMHLQSVQQFAGTALQARKYLLSAYRETIDKENKLSKLLLLAHAETGLSKRIRVEIQAIRKRTSCDIVDLVYLTDGASLVESELRRDLRLIRYGREERSLVEFRAFHGKLALVSYSPLYLFRDVLAVVVLGYYLNDKIAADVSKGTSAAVQFVPFDYSGPRSTAVLEIDQNAGSAVRVRVAVDNAFLSRERKDVRGEVIWAGTLSLLLVIVLVYIVLNFGFVKAFKTVLAQMDEGAKQLDEGRILEVQEKRYPIREVGSLSRALAKYSRGLKAFETRIRQKTRTEAAGELATQAAHDIDGPLIALESDLDLENAVDYSETRKNRIRGHITRIRDVVGEFSAISQSTKVSPEFAIQDDSSYLPREDTVSVLGICPLIEEVVAGKKAQYLDFPKIVISTEFQCDVKATFVRVESTEFGRTLSNLIDNAIEALPGEGSVKVRVAIQGHSVRIEVIDDGKGIPPDVLSKLGNRGVSFEKADGSGLGLWQAVGAVGSWGGDLAIESQEGKGTSVTILLSLESAPGSYLRELCIEAGSTIAVLDDDPGIIKVWKKKLRRLGKKVSIVSFAKAEALLIWRRAQPEVPVSFYLVDFELRGEDWTGLDVIDELGVQNQAVLVTGHSEDGKIQRECASKGVRLLAKSKINALPIHVTQRRKAAARRKA